jgi:hypothetical protein
MPYGNSSADSAVFAEKPFGKMVERGVVRRGYNTRREADNCLEMK